MHFLGALLLLALGYLVCFRLPLVDISHLIFGGSTGDPGLYAYLTERHIRFSFTGVHPWYEVGSFYPFAMSGAYSDNYLLPAFLTKAITSFGVSFEGAYNLSLCFAFLANGLSAFFLLRALKISFGWAVCGALAFMCAPKLAFHFGHPQLQWAFFIPLCFTSCLRFLEKRTWLSAQAIGSCVVLAFLCSAYYGVFAALLATVILALGFLQEKRVSSVINTAKRLFLANVLSLALLIVFAKPYFFVRSELFSPPISIATQQAAKPISYISAPVRNLLWGPLTSAWIKHEDYLFPGALILSFSLWGIFLLIREWTEMAKHHRALRYSHRWFILGVIFTVLGFILSGGITRLIPLSQALFLGAGLWSLLLSSVVALRFSSDVSIKKFREGLFLLVLLVFFLFTSFGSIGRAVDFFPAGGLFPLLYWYFPGMNAIRGLSRIGLIVDLILIIFACRAFQGSKLLQKSKLIVICCFSFLLLEYSFARFPANEEASLVHSHATILSQYADPEDAIVFLPMMTPDDGPAYPRYEVRNMRS
ncbi:MAG: hypothetical protein KDD55_04990, partial [Bdellovibrionales bacterium]|nr:hypothetical protein [Bdellovibrionales bacterium]